MNVESGSNLTKLPQLIIGIILSICSVQVPKSVVAQETEEAIPPLEVIGETEEEKETVFPFEKELRMLGLEPWPSRNSMVLKEYQNNGFTLSWWHTVEVRALDPEYGEGIKVSVFLRDKSQIPLSEISNIAAKVIALQYGFNDTVRMGYQAEILKLIERQHDSTAIYPIVYTKKRNYAVGAFVRARVNGSEKTVPTFTIDMFPGNPLNEAPSMPQSKLPSSTQEIV